MSDYTRLTTEDIYFLNDKNIISSIDDATVSKNAVVPQYIAQGISSSVDSQIGSMTKTNETGSGKIITSLSQTRGKLDYECRELEESDVKNLTVDLNQISSNYLKTIDFSNVLSSKFQNGRDFTYTTNTHTMELNVCGNKLSVDCTDLIKNGLVKRVDVFDVGGRRYVEIVFIRTDGTEDPIQIDLSSIAPIYKTGEGIRVTNDLCIYNDETIARTSNVNLSISQSESRSNTYTDNSIKSLSTDGILSVSDRLIYALEEKNGVVKTYSRALVSSDFNDGENPLSEENVGNQLNKFQIYGLTSDIHRIDSDISTINQLGNYGLKFNGHLSGRTILVSENISEVFQDPVFCETSKINNGSFIQIKNSDDNVCLSTVSGDLRTSDGDYIIVHDHDKNKAYLQSEELEMNKNVFLVKSGVSRYEFKNALSDICSITSDLSDLSDDYLAFKEDVNNRLSVLSDDLSGISADFYINDIEISGIKTFSDGIVTPYTCLYDTNGYRLSDIVTTSHSYGDLYNSIVNIIHHCELKNIDFNASKPLSSALDSINRIAINPKISVDGVELDVVNGTYEDSIKAMDKIVAESSYSGRRYLDKELKDIDTRFDSDEIAIEEHTKKIAELEKKVYESEQNYKDLADRLKALEDILNGKEIIIK